MHRTARKAVVFDLFGTLIEAFTLSAYDGTLQKMAGELDVDPTIFRDRWHASGQWRGDGTFASGQDNVRWCLREMGVTRSDARIDRAVDFRLELVRRWLVPRADVESTLLALRQRGLRIGLLSNAAREIPAVWPESRMSEWFDAAIFSCDVGMRKPAPAIFELVCQRLAVKPSEVLYVGDGDDQELEAATRAGMEAVQIRVAGEDTADVFRRHDQPWEGQRVQRIAAVLALA